MKNLIKNSAKATFIAVFGLLVISGCKKKEEEKKEDAQPVASFTTDKTEYYGGNTIILTSTSQNAGSVKWLLPDGSTSNEKVVSYSTQTTTIEYPLPFTLYATSPNGTKQDYVIQNIQVKPTPPEEDPVASFTTDKTEYYGGDTIILTSNSTGIGTLQWSNSTSTESVLIVPTTTTQISKVLSFTLTAISPSGAKKGYATKSIIVKPTIAKSAYLVKDFSDNSITSGGWTKVSVVNSSVSWITSSSEGNAENGYLPTAPYAYISGYYDGGSHASEAWLISPDIDLSSSTNPILNFANARQSPTFSEGGLKCYVSTNYTSGNPNTATWTELTYIPAFTLIFESSDNISLSSFKSSNTRIAFKYTSTNTEFSNTRWLIDDIVVANK